MRIAWRGHFALFLLLLGFLGIAVQLVRVQGLQAPDLQAQARRQAVHRVRVPAIRGAILDRRGEPLAVSTPVQSIYATPAQVTVGPAGIGRLGEILGMTPEALRRRLERDSPFVYLKRQVPPAVAARVRRLNLAGISSLREYRRYYPAGEVAAHVVGVAGVDGQGLEGMELAFDRTLSGRAGRRLVRRDALGRDIRTLRVLRPARAGATLRLSLDGRLQYVAYQALKEAVARQRATAGMAVVLDPRTGEILALANVPSYNPNHLAASGPEQRRNRVITDALEPGSIFKPFTVASALEEDLVRPGTMIHCENGLMRVGRHRVHDAHPLGRVAVQTIVQKSSNIGAAKIALHQENLQLWRQLRRFGFGLRPGTGFPGETRGILHSPSEWQRFDRATIGFGHGIAASALQVARAYAVLANDGRRLPLTLRRLESNEVPAGKRVIGADTARQVTGMLDLVVGPGGTGKRAGVAGYGVAGKTGTAQKPGPGGYQEGQYVASFAGFAPVEDPRLVAVVMIDEPQEAHYGGAVAAPVFRRVMERGLRFARVPPRPGDRQRPPLPLRQAREDAGEGRAS